MNLIENEEFNEKKKKSKTIMMIIVGIIILLLIISGILLYMIYTVQKNTLKLEIDNKSMNFANDMFVIDNNQLYIKIKDFAVLMGYETHNSEYKDRYSEDTTKCYISNQNENASYILNSNIIYKKALNNTDYEYFNLENPVKLINGNLYVSKDGMEIGTNSIIDFNSSINKITVISLNNIVTKYAAAFTNSAIGDDKADFNNRKALRYGLVVVKSTDGHYGVLNSEGQEIIGTKYKNISFKEDSKEFTVMTDENKMGILSSEGITKIEPNYDEIKQISTELNYYLVSNNKKYGVINQNGNIVIYLEYDKIGIDETKFNTSGIDNPYILYDNCILVQQNGKWGMFDINGKLILPVEYDEIGCISGTQTDVISNNVLTIPNYEAIVVGKGGKYGIVNSLGKEYVPTVFDSIYSVTTSGNDKFYMTYTRQVEENGQIVKKQETYDLDEYFDKFVLDKNNNQDNMKDETANNITNQIENNNINNVEM